MIQLTETLFSSAMEFCVMDLAIHLVTHFRTPVLKSELKQDLPLSLLGFLFYVIFFFSYLFTTQFQLEIETWATSSMTRTNETQVNFVCKRFAFNEPNLKHTVYFECNISYSFWIQQELCQSRKKTFFSIIPKTTMFCCDTWWFIDTKKKKKRKEKFVTI